MGATSILSKKLKNLKVVIAGSGSDRKLLDGLTALEKNYGIEDFLDKRLKYIPDKELSYYLQASDIVLIPYKKMSGHSSVIFLAYQHSRPVIATTVGGLNEAVIDGITGYKCKPNDHESLALAIEKAMLNKSKLVKMGREAKKFYKKNFSWEAIGKSTLAVYKNLIN